MIVKLLQRVLVILVRRKLIVNENFLNKEFDASFFVSEVAKSESKTLRSSVSSSGSVKHVPAML